MEVRIQRVDTKDFPNIGIYVNVRNRLGQNVYGLNKPDFFLYENDRRIGMIRSDSMDQFQNRLNLALLRENSQFFAENYTIHLAGALKSLLDPVRISDRIQVIRSSDEVRPVYEGLQRREILRHLSEGENAQTPGSGKALYEAVARLGQSLGPRHIVYVVSGRDFENAFSQYSVSRVQKYARSNGIRIHIISFEADPETASVYRDLAEFTGGSYFYALDEDALAGIYEKLARDIDERYILTYRTIKDKNLSGRYVDLRVEVNHLGTSGFGDAGFFVP